MARRGGELHEHIIDTAKFLFLSTGFDRTSMDAIAEGAGTTKRSVYAHFTTKDDLFLACLEHSHELFEGRLSKPAHYAEDPVAAVALFCARLAQLLAYAPIARVCRMAATEAGRMPQASARIHDSFLGTATTLLADYLATRQAGEREPRELALRLIGATVWPALTSVMFGLTALRDDLPDETELDADANTSVVAALLTKTTTPDCEVRS